MASRKDWVFVTGATSGMGRAAVGRCVSDGFGGVALGRNRAALEELDAEFSHAVRRLKVDLSAPNLEARVAKIAAELEADSARVVGLVNSAGISQGDSIAKIQDSDWERSMAVNVTAPMRLTRALLPALERAQKAAGSVSIVNIGSPVALIGARKVSYAASKAALFGLNSALAQDLGKIGIRVNAVLPGATITGMTEDWSQEKRAHIAAESPLGRLCRVEDIAGAVSFLLSEDASFITGTTLNVTGGTHIGW